MDQEAIKREVQEASLYLAWAAQIWYRPRQHIPQKTRYSARNLLPPNGARNLRLRHPKFDCFRYREMTDQVIGKSNNIILLLAWIFPYLQSWHCCRFIGISASLYYTLHFPSFLLVPFHSVYEHQRAISRIYCGGIGRLEDRLGLITIIWHVFSI